MSGVSRPAWMDDIEWSEYKMTEEYRYELTHVPDEPDYYDDFDDGYADFMAEEDHVIECRDCGEDVPISPYADTTECDECGALYNWAGQSLKPYDEWEDE